MRVVPRPCTALLRILGIGLALAISAGGCSSADSGGRKFIAALAGGTISGPGGARLTIPPGALSRDTAVSMRRGAGADRSIAGPKGLRSIGGAVVVDAGGATFTKPVQLALPFEPSKVPPGTPDNWVFLGYTDSQSSRWIPVASNVDRAHKLINATVTHLSSWDPRTWDISAVGSAITDGLVRVLRVDGIRAEPPNCQAAPSDVSREIAPDEVVDPLLACIEAAVQGANVKLVNNRGFGVVVTTPAGAIETQRSQGGIFDRIANALGAAGTRAVYLPGGGSVAFHFDAPLLSELTFTSTPTVQTMAVDLAAPYLTTLLPDVNEAGLSPPESKAAEDALVFKTADCLARGTDTSVAPSLVELASLAKQCVDTAITNVELPWIQAVTAKLGSPLQLVETALKLGDANIDSYFRAGLGKVTFLGTKAFNHAAASRTTTNARSGSGSPAGSGSEVIIGDPGDVQFGLRVERLSLSIHDHPPGLADAPPGSTYVNWTVRIRNLLTDRSVDAPVLHWNLVVPSDLHKNPMNSNKCEFGDAQFSDGCISPLPATNEPDLSFTVLPPGSSKELDFWTLEYDKLKRADIQLEVMGPGTTQFHLLPIPQ